jgi:hypothetical protein
MTTVHYDASMSDDERRRRLFAGDIFVYSPTKVALELVAFARSMVKEAFGSADPEVAQYSMAVAQYAQLLGEFKPRFIHHPECKRLVPQLLGELGCDLEQTYFDVPRIRTSTSDKYLTSGIAYAWHPHRDTWYSAPMCQVNFWTPVYPITSDNCMAFHPRYWSKPLANDSHKYNYQEWNRTNRFNAAQHIGEDKRPLPKPTEPVEIEPDLRLVMPPGGVILFSAAQLHSSVPNTSSRTRFSIDWRTVQLGDVVELRGAPNIDSYCTGSTMGDYLRCTDHTHLPAAATSPYDAGTPQRPQQPTVTGGAA